MARQQPNSFEQCTGNEEFIGIDLGTSFCLGAYFDFATQKPSMITIDQKKKMASWINMYGLKTKDKSCWIGNCAKDSEFSEYALYDSKRFIGKKKHEICEEVESYPFKVYERMDSLVMATDNPINSEEISLTPEQVSALLLKKVFSIAKRARGNNIRNVVIAVPAYFNDNQRQATLRAARIAGIDVARLIKEPIAALLAYKNSFPNDFYKVKCSIVFDWRMTTLDISVCENVDDRIDVIVCGGDQNLGEIDFNLVLMNIIKERILEEYPKGKKYFEKQNRETGNDKKLREQVLCGLKKAAEIVKNELSKKTMTDIPLDRIFKGDLEGVEDEIGDIQILREDFEEGCQELFERCRDCLKDTVNECGLSKRDIDKVIFIGDYPIIPKIRGIIGDYFNNEKIICNSQFDPITAIAKGAAIDACCPGCFIRNPKTINFVPQSIGIEVEQSIFSKIINKGSPVPTKGYRDLVLKKGVNELNINIYQGEGDFVDSPGMQFIESVELVNKSTHATINFIRIIFKLDNNQNLEITVIDLNNENNKTSIIIELKDFGDEIIKHYQSEIHEIMPDDI
ncbi:70kDa heat shock protein [Entamoeba marina]